MVAHIQGRSTGRKRKRLMSEINVTPMVDVMLVLLIIFMITSPMLVAGIEVDLPETDSAAVSGQTNPLIITVDKDGKIFLVKTKIEPKDLVAKLNAFTKEKTDAPIFVQGDKNASYGTILDVMARINNAGFTKVTLLVSDIKQK
jgi:biopolymer transport protein TolR